MNSDVNLHLRNNMIKLQSLVHNQLSSPRYINIFKQVWFKSNYIDKKPEKFDNPVEFGFGDSQPHCEIPGCKNVAITVIFVRKRKSYVKISFCKHK